MYSANSVMDCNNTDETGPSPAFLYSCNGEKKTCRAFLIFKSQTPYNSVTSISNLTSSDPLELARINNISSLALFPPDKEGLSTCDSLERENIYGEFDLDAGLKLQVPLRCACPTSNQTVNGTKFMLTYLVSWGDTVPQLSERFNVSAESVAYANGFSEEDPTLYPFTTILIPLPTEPLSSQTIIHYPLVVSPPPAPNPKKKGSKKGLHFGIGTGIFLTVLCFVLFVVFLHHKRSKTDDGAGKKKWILPKDLLVGIASVDQVLKVYEFEELEAATENFSPQKRLSDSVYRGFLRGKVLAIKKTKTDVSKEVNMLTKINHFNLISLNGACKHHGVFYLVYEYMENGSLKDWLHKKSSPEPESWNNRIRIALDVANGLHYLHNFTDPACVHKDINSSNILLNRDLRAKIAHFNLTRSAEGGENGSSSTSFVLGTKGYMAPEYLETGMVTPKMDTYAFGVVLLELITGREAVFKEDGEEMLLSEVVISIMDRGNAEAELGFLVDPRLQVNNQLGCIIERAKLVLCMVKLSVACLAQEPASRPSMAEGVSTLMQIQLDMQKSEPLSMTYVFA
ncbi:hypothetical protein F0562_006493 [Nyssa sinensis]|uniref:Protein kinase domain-containing protein n=1 Tax=Nyssa sinensis TaxID=561372 RepID=A0A5J5AM31_9ASTE|nr:hypothetical protein F0562_006493 [Nyssa sinensis]